MTLKILDNANYQLNEGNGGYVRLPKADGYKQSDTGLVWASTYFLSGRQP